RNWPGTGRPGVLPGRLARPASRPLVDGTLTARVGVGSITLTTAVVGAGGPRGLWGFRVTDRATRPPGLPRGLRGLPRASGRRGPGEDSTAARGVARRFCHTP